MENNFLNQTRTGLKHSIIFVKGEESRWLLGEQDAFLLDSLVFVKNLVIWAFVVIWGLYGDLGSCPLGEGKSTEVEIRWNFGSEADRQYEKD